MNDKNLEKKVIEELEKEIEERGYAAPVDVLMALGYLSSGDYKEWREGRVPFLEKVLRIGPSKVLDLMSVMSAYSKKNGYKPRVTEYIKSGKGNESLRFSRTGNEVIEDRFATHYIDPRF